MNFQKLFAHYENPDLTERYNQFLEDNHLSAEQTDTRVVEKFLADWLDQDVYQLCVNKEIEDILFDSLQNIYGELPPYGTWDIEQYLLDLKLEGTAFLCMINNIWYLAFLTE